MRLLHYLRAILIVALMLGATATARAAATVNEILVRYDPSPLNVNIRVDVYNPDNVIVRGPIQVTLYIRGAEGESWRKLFSYPPLGKILEGRHIALDYFTPQDNIDPALQSGTFQLRAVAVFPDGRESSLEKSYP